MNDYTDPGQDLAQAVQFLAESLATDAETVKERAPFPSGLMLGTSRSLLKAVAAFKTAEDSKPF